MQSVPGMKYEALPALVADRFETFSKPFFFKMKLLPVKTADVTARHRPIQKSLSASSLVSGRYASVVTLVRLPYVLFG